MAGPSKGNAKIGTSSALIVAANTGRNGVILTNEGDDDVWLGFGEAAVENEGMKVPAGGSAVCHYGGRPDRYDDIFEQAVYGIASGAGNVVAYQEI